MAPWIPPRNLALFALLLGCMAPTRNRISTPRSTPHLVGTREVVEPEHVATLTLCPPSDLGFPATPPTAAEGVSRVLGIRHDRCESSVPWWPIDDDARWSDTFYVATDPPARITCPEPGTGWFAATRRMIVRQRAGSVSLECVVEPLVSPDERAVLGRWEVPLRGALDARSLASGRLADTSTWAAERAPSAQATRAYPSRQACDPTDDDVALGAPMRVTAGVDQGLLVAAAYTVGERICASVLRGPRALEPRFIDAPMLAAALDAPAVAPVDDLIGTWTDEDGFDVFVLRRDGAHAGARCERGEPLRAIGCAWWYGGEGGVDGEIVHGGGFDATVCSGDPVLRLHEDESGCSVLLAADGTGSLVVHDNEHCGGMNVRFRGRFSRRAWHPASQWQVCPVAAPPRGRRHGSPRGAAQ